eukprot:TRINITY_DN5944_c0_g1_i1.p1 TRINITY_DN5944_c0_g1~~TRINITY_DN5944_c0_g1_i1.p1  ORF type:complete len:244 (-),score=38.13 TRINITY_DN5944_c0_g1_i1:79-810(-)
MEALAKGFTEMKALHAEMRSSETSLNEKEVAIEALQKDALTIRSDLCHLTQKFTASEHFLRDILGKRHSNSSGEDASRSAMQQQQESQQEGAPAPLGGIYATSPSIQQHKKKQRLSSPNHTQRKDGDGLLEGMKLHMHQEGPVTVPDPQHDVQQQPAVVMDVEKIEESAAAHYTATRLAAKSGPVKPHHCDGPRSDCYSDCAVCRTGALANILCYKCGHHLHPHCTTEVTDESGNTLVCCGKC